MLQEALLEMDGVSLSEVALTLAGTETLVAAGGNEGWYLVVYFPDTHTYTPSLQGQSRQVT